MPDTQRTDGVSSAGGGEGGPLSALGLERRGLLRLLGAGAGVAALGETAAADRGRDARIDDVFGAPYAASESPPPGLVDHTVELHGEGPPAPFAFHFDPVGIHVRPGSVVDFRNVSVEHTVTAFHDKFAPFFPTRVPGDVPGFTSPPYVGGETWLYRFEESGVYDLFCFPHLALGMAMRVVALDPRRDDIADLTDYGALPNVGPPGEDPLGLVEQVLTHEALDPGNIVAEGTVDWHHLGL